MNKTKKDLGGNGLRRTGEAEVKGGGDGAWYLHPRAELWHVPPAPAASYASRPPVWLWTEPYSAVPLPRTPRPQAGSECSPCWHQASPHHGSWLPTVHKKWLALCRLISTLQQLVSHKQGHKNHRIRLETNDLQISHCKLGPHFGPREAMEHFQFAIWAFLKVMHSCTMHMHSSVPLDDTNT